MADKYVNATGVQIIKTWIEGKFATDADLTALSERVDDIVAEGGEPNTIETISVNGTNVPPDGNKNVALTVPTAGSAQDTSGYATYGALTTGLADKADTADVPTKVSDLVNDGDGTQGSAFATEDYVDQNGGKIDVIKVNGTTQTITNKAVDITVPTAVSDLTNDSGFQTANDVSTAIGQAVASAYIYKGSVATVNDLPASGNTTGDVYDVQATGVNYAWTGSAWDALGTYVDTSVFWTSTSGQANTLEAMTVAEINAILTPTP